MRDPACDVLPQVVSPPLIYIDQGEVDIDGSGVVNVPPITVAFWFFTNSSTTLT